MDLDKAREFVRNNHRAVMLTWHPDGRPQTSPVTVGCDEDGHIVVSSRETAVKTRNLRNNPQVVLTVTTDAFFGAWVQIEGKAEVVPLPEAMEPLVQYYRDISGEHPDWDDYRAAMVRDKRVIIRIEPTRAGPDHHG
ncbi:MULTISPECIES: PPOX class F420-dependent oxidoreductase [Microbispora]|uniref:PPOX class F420-dependent oxidoreductase n=2 Tax=Microbispora TaxID=2005 RepID=A0A5J5JVM7_9ACTN|nr:MULTISPECIES: PPOX class F420-dependent oxidoreductase [Microbispora]KAA9375282.1 PPOX class F420-dependent oxidoreductase [Microbispora cellulosiformans]GIH35168.1 PPOX class F420-dependent enzyme [Microbispora amethystogenes]